MVRIYLVLAHNVMTPKSKMLSTKCIFHGMDASHRKFGGKEYPHGMLLNRYLYERISFLMHATFYYVFSWLSFIATYERDYN